MKKVLLAISMVVLSLFAVGCEKTIDLTDEENRIIAEYAAELLIKYDRNMDQKYYDDTTQFVPVTEEATTEQAEAEQPEASEDTTEDDSTEEIASTDAPTEDVTEEEEIPEVEVETKDFDLGEFIGNSNVSITYSHYLILDRYPSYDKDGVYIEIEAPKGYKLLVVKFNMMNKTNESQYLDLYNMGIEYQIIVNDKKSAKQMLTILLDDLYTYQKNLEGGMREETVLIFQLSDGVANSIQNLKLKVSLDGNQKTISLN